MKNSESKHQISSLEEISVVIAARNEGRTIRACVESVLRAGKGKAEIMVVDDGSTDDTPEILEGFNSSLRLLEGGGEGPGHARNLAVKATHKNWIAFTDADCVVAEDWLEKLREGVGGKASIFSSVGGRQEIPVQAKGVERLVGQFFEKVGFVSDYVHASTEITSVAHNPTCNVLYSRQALEAAEGFDETLWPCEDLDLDLRLEKMGYQALFQPLAVVEHHRPATFKAYGQMMKRYGAAHAQLVRKHGFCQKLHLLPLVVPFLVGGFLGIVWFSWQLALVGILTGLLAITAFFYGRGSSGKSFAFTGLLIGGTLAWLRGFYGQLWPRKKKMERNG